MLTSTKSYITLGTVWIATLALAFWLGGKRELTGRGDGPTGNSSQLQARGSGSGGAASNPNIDAIDTGVAGEGGPAKLRTIAGGSAGAANRILKLLEGNSGVDLSRDDFRDLAENLSLEEVLGVVDLIAAMDPSPAQRDAYNEVLARWGQLDGTAALDHVAGIAAPKSRYDATMIVLKNWAATDPASALAFADENPGNHLPDGSISSVFRGIGDSMDTASALAFLGGLNDERHQLHVGDAVRDLYERNSAEVIKWTEGLPPGEIRDRSVRALVDQWARYDPLAAKEWLASNTTESNRPAAMLELGESWARIDPEAAATWAQGLGAGQDGNAVMDRVLRRWMQYDFAEAANFLVQQQPSPMYDGALEQYIQKVKSVDPNATMSWAEAISDPRRRRNAVHSVAKRLRESDPDAFRSYVETSDVFSEDERNRLLGIKPKKDKPERDRS